MIEEIKYSPVESARFGMNVYRGNITDPNAKVIRNLIVKNAVDLMILRIPSTSKNKHYLLLEAGFDVIHADTLVYYTCNLQKAEIKQPVNSLDFVPISSENAGVLQEMIPVIFEGYQNHYFSNPVLDENLIKQGYIEWASSYHEDAEGRISWLVADQGECIGFATCSFDQDTREAEGVLYGVMPKAAGRGVYSDIIRFTQNYFKGKGYSTMVVSTQIQNIAVQKVWGRESFFINKSYDTYHLNSMLGLTQSSDFEESVYLTEEMVRQFAEYSGDWNPVHFSPEAGKAAGFNGRISHGMIPLSMMSKVFASQFPGPGTLFLSNRNIFLSPFYPNQSYRFKYVQLKSDESGRITVLVKIYNEAGVCCLVSYNQLIRRVTS
jgi:acyl dehydratase